MEQRKQCQQCLEWFPSKEITNDWTLCPHCEHCPEVIKTNPTPTNSTAAVNNVGLVRVFGDSMENYKPQEPKLKTVTWRKETKN